MAEMPGPDYSLVTTAELAEHLRALAERFPPKGELAAVMAEAARRLRATVPPAG